MQNEREMRSAMSAGNKQLTAIWTFKGVYKSPRVPYGSRMKEEASTVAFRSIFSDFLLANGG